MTMSPARLMVGPAAFQQKPKKEKSFFFYHASPMLYAHAACTELTPHVQHIEKK
jgi:hypothetical protein